MIASTGYDVFDTEDILLNSVYLWTFDDVKDIKDQQGASWAQQSNQLQSIAGVRGRAVRLSGGPGPIPLAYDQKFLLSTPITYAQVTVSLWLLYESSTPGVAQTLLAVGDQENGDRGIHLYQEEGSREELTFSVKVDLRQCLVKFEVPQRVWTHLVFTWSRTTGLDPITVYRDGIIITDLLVDNCHDGDFANLPNNIIALGSSTLPTASIDDVMAIGKKLSKFQVEQLFRYYKGNVKGH